MLGLADRPGEQAQDPFVLDLERTGCVAVAGTVRAGRSTVLRTLAAALAAGTSPADLHLYALDCGNQALAPLSALPHCGAVVPGDDTARTERLLTLLHDEVGRRQRRLSVAGHASLAEHRAALRSEAGEPLPYLVLLIDRLEGFLARYAELDGGRAVDRLESLLRTGPAVGVTTVLSTDRTGFPHRISSAISARLVLRQATTDDAAAFGVDPRGLPRHLPAGRAVWADTGEQVQIALLDPDPAGAAQTAAVERLAVALATRWDGTGADRLPRRLDPLPDELTAADAEALRRRDRPAGAAVCTPAVGGDQLGPVDVDLADLGGAFVVAGPQRSGRSTALLAVVRSLTGHRDDRLPVLVVATRPSPLRDLAGEPGVIGVLTGDATEIAAEIADAAGSGPFALVIDDGELLTDFELTELLEVFARGARDSGSLLIAAATTEDLQASPYRGWLATARRGRCGLLLDPASHVDGEVFGLRLPRSVNGGWPPGRGLLVRRGTAEPVQVVLPERTPAAGSRRR
ncbi:FtsK/SpoIIIE domain-containing protein [Dactylosporangium sp. NBC_01737]|uniref:FtsK/SpoIIIE domain-containing protein n=1 Tax=Dactylosporangium sp. NBC_01737 TaxID=2975959 RepID=UPI002E126FFE|nr:FtsK/SpoIIIE domain-containing protein [Dactylosporangium sp. NBC_01737]